MDCAGAGEAADAGSTGTCYNQPVDPRQSRASMNAPEAYEQYLVPHIFRPWAEEVVRRAGRLESQRILDVATGTGIAARLAAIAAGAKGGVTGLDIDPAALAVAARTGTSQPSAPIDWVEGNAMAMPFPDAGFDAAFCLEGLQFFPDRVAGLAEIRRVLVPGGRLFASCWAALADNPGYHAISEGLRLFCSETAARLPPFALADADEIARAVRAAGFSTVAVERHGMALRAPSAREWVGWLAAGGPTMRHCIAQLTPDRQEDFLRFVEQFLAPFAGDGGLLIPSARHVVCARC
jgi:ubiquinone/menaquinone biosynthesis C-methylase UbiE